MIASVLSPVALAPAKAAGDLPTLRELVATAQTNDPLTSYGRPICDEIRRVEKVDVGLTRRNGNDPYWTFDARPVSSRHPRE